MIDSEAFGVSFSLPSRELHIAPHAVRAGANIVEDVVSGNTWKDSALKHGPSVIEQIPGAISAGVAGRKRQSGSGYRRRRTKRARRDIFS